MRTSPLAGALLAMAAAPWCVCARDCITIAVLNYAGAPPRAVSFAVETAQRAFRSAGIDSRWIVCSPENCRQQVPAGTPYFEVLLMPRFVKPPADGSLVNSAGFAMLGGFSHPRAYAFYDVAQAAAERTLRPLYTVLGCILVHEACHLLGLHHQPRGVMRASLEPNDMDDTTRGRGFSEEERRMLRAAAHARALLKTSDAPITAGSVGCPVSAGSAPGSSSSDPGC